MLIRSLCPSYPHQCVALLRDATGVQASVWTSVNLSEDKGFISLSSTHISQWANPACPSVRKSGLPNSPTNWKVLQTMATCQRFGGIRSSPPAQRASLPPAPRTNHYLSVKKIPFIQLTVVGNMPCTQLCCVSEGLWVETETPAPLAPLPACCGSAALFHSPPRVEDKIPEQQN